MKTGSGPSIVIGHMAPAHACQLPCDPLPGRMETAVTSFMSKSVKQHKAQDIVEDIVNDLSDRRGLGQEWDMLDPEMRDEIKAAWIALAVERI